MFDQSYLNQLEANYKLAQPKAQPPAKGPGGLAGFLVNNLPSIAGGIGLVGGEILDPFGGGLLTGSAASGAGEALKEKLLGQSLSPKQIAIQAGETAALGGLGKGFSAAKAGSKALLGTDSAVENAAKPSIASRFTNAIVNKGTQEEANLGGYAVGQKVGGDKLGTAASQQIAQTMQDQGINGLTAKEAQAQIESKLADLNKARESLYTIHNTPLAVTDRTALTKAVNTALSKAAGGSTPTVKNLAATYTKEALGQGDLTGLAKYKTSLDNNLINWNRNPASVEPGAQIAAGAVRGALKDFLQNKVPGLAEIDKPYSNLSTANEALKTAAGRTANLSTAGGGIWGKLLNGEIAEKGKGVYARGLQTTGKALGGKATTPAAAKDIATIKPTFNTNISGASGIRNNLLGRTVAPILGKPGTTTASVGKQIIGRALAGNAFSGGNNSQPTDLSTALAQAGMSQNGISPQKSPITNANHSPYPLENVLYDISRDPKNAATYEAIYKLANPVDNSQALDATQQKEVSASQAAIGRIQQYGQQLEGASGGNVATGSLATVMGKYNPFASEADKNAAALQSSRRDVAIQLATALMGGNKPSAQSVDEIEQSLPSVNDSPQLRQAKINSIISGLQENLKNYATPISQITSGLGYGSTTNGDVGSQLNSVLASLGQQ